MIGLRLFIGAPLTHGSDRAVLLRACGELTRRSEPAVILANVQIEGVQVDLIVATGRRVLLVEAKAWHGIVRGAENGSWQVQTAHKGWKEAGNPYQQALTAKHALRDARGRFAGSTSPYPDAAVIFCPEVPRGSSLPSGDYKVTIGSLDLLAQIIVAGSNQDWSLDQWRAFARHLRLAEVSSINAATDPAVFDSERLISAYGSSFRQCYAPLVEGLVDVPCRDAAGGFVATRDAAQRSVDMLGTLITGPSGCGKTLLGYAVALAALDRGLLPVVVAAKDFQGDLREVLNAEAALLGAQNARSLVSACRRVGRQMLVVIDGYNECPAGQRSRLTRSLAAAARRYEAKLVVSSQVAIGRPDLLVLQELTVSPPDREVKRAIAARAAGEPLDATLETLIASVETGLEAGLIGALGRSLAKGASRFDLFDAYARMRLGPVASEGTALLSRLAGAMLDQTRFSLSRREADRLADGAGLAPSVMRMLHTHDLLGTHGDRVSFRHELFTYAFMAEAIVRRAGGDAAAVAAAIRVPWHAQHAALILGAVDDEAVVRQILSESGEVRLFRSCLFGHCGVSARSWTEELCRNVLIRAREELDRLTFVLDGDALLGVSVNQESVSDWSDHERSLLAAIPEQLLAGTFLDETLQLFSKADAVLTRELGRLRDEARGKKVALRSGLFEAAYIKRGSGAPATAQIVDPIWRGMLYSASEYRGGVDFRGRMADVALGDGQLLLLLLLLRHARSDRPSIADVLAGLIGSRWESAPYRVRDQLVEAAQCDGHATTDAERVCLIRALEDLPNIRNTMLSTAIIDALKALGALEGDEQEHVANVRRMADEALAAPDDVERQQLAATLWTCQFDHPYDGAYCQVWNDLGDADRKTLLIMTAKATEPGSWFSGILVASLASLGDPSTASVIERWTSPPSIVAANLSDGIEAFAIAHAALARLRAALPRPMRHGAVEGILIDAGEIVYWLNRIDLACADRRAACESALSRLKSADATVAADILTRLASARTLFEEATRSLPGGEQAECNIARFFPETAAEVFRAVLRRPGGRGYFQNLGEYEILSACVSALAGVGTSADIPLLRVYAAVPRLAAGAMDAIRRLEGVRGEGFDRIASDALMPTCSDALQGNLASVVLNAGQQAPELGRDLRDEDVDERQRSLVR